MNIWQYIDRHPWWTLVYLIILSVSFASAWGRKL